jgi:class 3 adenylate cyclase
VTTTTEVAEGIVTILFTDVEGSTALHAAEGDSEARRLLSARDEVIRQEVHEHGGREVKSIEDGFMVAFGSPRKAVVCALAMQAATTTRARSERARAADRTGVRGGARPARTDRERRGTDPRHTARGEPYDYLFELASPFAELHRRSPAERAALVASCGSSCPT